MTLSSAWSDSCRAILNLKTKKLCPLWPLYLRHVRSFADCPLSMFLYVVATKVVTDFNDNDKRLKVYRQETKKSIQWTLPMKTTFSKWHQQLCQTQVLSDTLFEGFHPNFPKKSWHRFWRSHIHIPTWHEYKFCQGWEGKPSGQEKNPVEKVYKGL